LPGGLISRIRVKSPIKKISLFQNIKSGVWMPLFRLHQGAYRDRHGRGKRDAMDAQAVPDERGRCERPSRVVPISRRWDQALRDVAQGDGGYQAGTPAAHRGEHEAAVKTNRAGNAGLFRRTCR
jgi:hypothetical protein